MSNCLLVPHRLIPELVTLARKAGDAIMDVYATEFERYEKADQSPLTEADLRSHEVIRAGLAEVTPDLPQLSEESKHAPYQERVSWTRFWLIDPLDGTKEFLKRNGEFTVNIALIEGGRPVLGIVHAPALQTTFVGDGTTAVRHNPAGEVSPIRCSPPQARTLRVVASRSHGSADTDAYLDRLGADFDVELVAIGSSLKLCKVASGEAHLYPRFGPTMEWDTAAAQAVVESAGGSVVQLDGKPLVYNKPDLLNPYFLVCPGPPEPWLHLGG